MKSQVEEREKRARSWCQNYILISNVSASSFKLMILTIMEISKENHMSRVLKIVNLASCCYAQPQVANLGSIMHLADNIGPIIHQ